ncbi:MAG: hypothetical protein RQ745_01915 [Longimicrobiales bacterium]|nr:hypothetical protein [Longimicrobiales bacterium]
MRLRTLALVLLPPLLALGTMAHAVRAQDDGLRIGIYFGGTSAVGILFDLFDDSGSTELTIGTFTFRDLSLSVVRRHRFGDGDLQPTIGAGLWVVTAIPGEDEQTGLALVLRAPVGLEWNVSGDHFVNGDLNLNRAIFVRRTDPEDDLPPASRIIPLPGLSYRWLSN